MFSRIAFGIGVLAASVHYVCRYLWVFEVRDLRSSWSSGLVVVITIVIVAFLFTKQEPGLKELVPQHHTERV